ncbi:recombinase family protein [Lachnospiraceae bacterium 38-14]
MHSEKIKVYTYTRVSTTMQTDGYSLDAQKARMKAYADYNDYEIVGTYEDAGKSGKSIEGRIEFNRMMEDIESGKDGISFVLVFKLSRFGRNAADVLSTLQVMQDFGVNLICVEDGIDSSKDAGKLMISVLSAVAEIERENIRVQTMEGRIQKAREGKWNGGFAPYGYQLIDGKLQINEEEAKAIRTIFEQYVHTDIGANGVAKYLENHGIRKIQRQNGKNPLFDAHLVRLILKNPVYCGKIAYGRRKTEKIHGTRNEYHLVEQDNYILVDGQHDAIIEEDVWQAAQVKLLAQAKKYEHVNRGKDTKTHLLSGIVKCPVCGAGMYGNKSIKRKKDGTKYKDFYYYGCKHRTMTRGHKCDYKKQIREELLDDAVAEVIVKLVGNPKFAAMMQEKINCKVDTVTIDGELADFEKQLRQYYVVKLKLAEEIDSLDPDDRHYIKRKADLDDRLYRMYDKIENVETQLIETRAKKQAIEAEKLTGDNIYKVLIYFEKLYAVMNEIERRQFMETLISEIQIYEDRQPNGQWLKSIKFRLPIIEEDMDFCLEDDKHVETIVCLSHKSPDSVINVKVEFGEGEGKVPLDTIAERAKKYQPKPKITYKMIQEYVKKKYGFKVHTAYIAEVKRSLGLTMYGAPNAVEELKHPRKRSPKEKIEAITDALRYFEVI